MQAIKLSTCVSSDIEGGKATVMPEILENVRDADNQYDPLNWTAQQDRNNPTFLAAYEIDRESHYIFDLHDTYNLVVGSFAVAKEVAERVDFKQPETFHHYAQFWPKREVGFFPNELFNSTTFAALASPYTFIRPVIVSPSDTLILTERPFSHFAAIRNLHNYHWKDLSSALSGYEVKGLANVKTYLKNNMDLLDFLTSLPAYSFSSEIVESVELEFYHDIEEHWEKLFVVVNTRPDDMDELDEFENSLYFSLFEPKTKMLSGRVVLSVG